MPEQNLLLTKQYHPHPAIFQSLGKSSCREKKGRKKVKTETYMIRKMRFWESKLDRTLELTQVSMLLLLVHDHSLPKQFSLLKP